MKSSVLSFVSLDDLFKATQHSLEALSIDRSNSDSIDSLDTGLSVDIMDKGKLSEIVSFLVLVDDSWELIVGLLLFCDQVAFDDDVEFISTFSLLDDVLTLLKLLFLKDVIELFPDIK